MKCTIKAFGITKDIIGDKDTVMEIASHATVKDLKLVLEAAYPDLKTLKSLFIAVNSVYADEQLQLKEADEVALIPPVSGG